MNLNSVKCHIAGLAVLVAAAASAAVPARFCEYIESSTSGSTATYVDTGLKPHCANGKYFVDFEISAASLPGSVVYLFGYREKSGISNQMMDIALNASGTFRLDSLYKDTSNYTSSSMTATPGHRYNLTVRKRYNYNGERCNIEDLTSGARAKSGSGGQKYGNNCANSFCLFSAKIGSTVSTATISQKLYAAKIWNDGSTLNGDYIPCVTTAGKFGLYNVVDGSIKEASPQANFSASAADSPFARVTNGEVEFCAHITAQTGVQISIDGGETWVSSVDVWTKAGGDSFVVKARPDPSVPFAVFTGWSAGSAHRLDFSGGSGISTDTMTLTAGKVRDIVATAKVGGYTPQAELIANGNFEAYDYDWHGGGARGAVSTTYCSTTDAAMNSYFWTVDNGTGSIGNPDLRRFNIFMPPAKYKLSYGSAMSNNQSVNNNVAEMWNTSDTSRFSGSSVTNSITKTYTVYSKTFTYNTARTATLRISRTANSTYKHSLDNVSLKMQLPISGVVVTAEPELYQVDSAPSYNWFPMQDGRTDTFTAPSGTQFLNADETARGYVRGYRIDTYDTANSTWVLGEEEIPSLSYVHTQNANECKRLVWLWTAENKISVVSQSATELVSTNGTDWVQSLEEWYPYNSTASIYAGSTPSMYYTWEGLPTGSTYGAMNAVVTVPMNAPRSLVLTDRPAVLTHIWAGPSANFGTASAWRTPSGDVASAAPGLDSVAYIPPGSTCTVATAFSISKLYVGDVFDTRSAQTVSLTFATGLKTNEVATTIDIGKGATLTHSENGAGTTAVAAQQLNLKAGSTITIASGAKINAKAKGFNASKGPAPGASNTNGGSHAGVGANGSGINANKCYGSIRKPTSPGSGGGTKGGGVVYLATPGTLRLDGTIDASGENITYYRSGAGGSVFIEVGTLLGSGSVDVRGGSGTYSYQGGAGRISVIQSVAETLGFTGSLNAGCIKARSGAGTVYIENASDVPGQGELIVDSFGTTPESDCVCRLDTSVTDRSQLFGKVTVKRNARLQIPSGVTLKVAKALTTTGAYLSTVSTGGAIEFVPGSGGTVDVAGKVSAYSFFCTNSPNATLRFANGAVLTNFNNGVSAFTSEAGQLSMLPATAEAKWNLDIGSGVSMDASRLSVSNCVARGVSFGAVESSDLGGNTNCNFTSSIHPGDPITWTGADDTLWGNSNNWQPSRTPVDTDVVTIKANCPNYPVISGNDVTVNTITNEAGATLTLRGADLIVTNALTSAGSLVFSGGWENLILTGDGEQKVDFANTTIERITVDKPAGAVTFEHGFKVNKVFKCNSSNPLAFYFEPGETCEVDQLFVDGMVSDGEGGVNSMITMASSAAPGKWRLKATKSQRVRGVTASDCDASLGEPIRVGLLATDGQGNVNWDFGETAVADWVGGASTAFATAANWLPAAVPTADTCVTVTPRAGTTYTVAISAATEVKNLILGGDKGAVAFTSSARVTVGDDFEVRTNSTATLNYFAAANIVSNLTVRSGGKITHGTATASGPKLYIDASGDILVESGAAICADSTSSGGEGAGTGAYVCASHGGTGHGSTSDKCFGSVFEPFENGCSTVHLGKGGGSVRLVAAGRLHINGRVTAYGWLHVSGGGGSGGSVWLTAGVISGYGKISTDCVTDIETGTLNGNYTGGGGRIALYQTVANDWSELHITPTCSGSPAESTIRGGTGTVYWQLPSEAPHGGRITITPVAKTSTGTGFPGTADGDVRNAYKDAKLELGANSYLVVTNASLTASGGTMRIRDIDIKATTAKIALYENTIKVLSMEHKGGKNWTVGSDYAARVAAGAIDTSRGGKIVWPVGMRVTIR